MSTQVGIRMNWNKKTVQLSQIKEYEANPRNITEKGLADLKKSIKNFGQAEPLVVNTDMTLIGGHARKLAMESLDYETCDVYIPSKKLTDKQVQELNIRLNKNIAGEFDTDKLTEFFEREDLTEWGFEDFELDFEEPEAEEDDYEVPEEETIETDIQEGDLIEIGKHRLLCGDSTDSDQVAKLMDGKKADLAHNDPPYGMKKEVDGVLNDNLNYDDLLQFNNKWIPLQFTFLKDNGSWYCWGIDEPLMDIYSEILKPHIKQQKATFRNLITWNKGNGQGQNSENTRSYAIADEKCLFVMCGVQGFNDNADNYFEGFESIRSYLVNERDKMKWNTSDVIDITGKTTASHYFSKSQWGFPTKEHYEAIREKANGAAFKKEYKVLKREYEELKKKYYSKRSYFNNTHDNFNNVWHFDRHKKDGTEGNHATPKPISLCERVIKSSCPDKGLVIDFFLGSGSTMVACEQLKRTCYGMELDPKYCQVIIDRMLSSFPDLKVKINNKPYN